MPTIRSDAPGYWMDEAGGRLALAVETYLNGGAMTYADVALVRAYLCQWIESSVWDANPSADIESRACLDGLRHRARRIMTRGDVSRWLEAALEEGIDPL